MISTAEIRLGRMGTRRQCFRYVEFEVPMGHQVKAVYSKKFEIWIWMKVRA